jgi:uncharacterized protein
MNLTSEESWRPEAASDKARDVLALLDWRRRIAQLYAQVRAEADPQSAWRHWRRTRDGLFKRHQQSPLEPKQQRAFEALPFFPYDGSLRMQVGLLPIAKPTPEIEPEIEMDLGADDTLRMRAWARTDGLKRKLGGELTVFWISGYGGGVFLPFADPTNNHETYGGTGKLILDFNFAYNPSCCYSARYVCPLAPPMSRLSVSVRAGEMLPGR